MSTVPPLVQLLTPEGQRVEDPTYAIDLSPDELRGLYRDLVLVRRWDVEATALSLEGATDRQAMVRPGWEKVADHALEWALKHAR